MSHARVTLALVFTTSLVTGCLDLDEQSLVHDLRILAIKTEPAELLLDASYALGDLGGGAPGGGGVPGGGAPGGGALPTADGFTVDIEVFAYDPRGGLVTMSSFLCPDGVDSTCVGYDAQTEVLDDVEDLDERAERAALFLPSVSVAEVDQTDEHPIGRAPLPQLTWEMTPSVISALTANAFGSAAVGVETIEPRIVVELNSTAQGGVGHATAFKRIPMVWDLHDPALGTSVNAALSPYDIELCPDDTPTFEEEGTAPCARRRQPNRNPVLLGFDIVDEIAAAAAGDELPPVRESEEPQLGPNPTLLVEAGGILTLRPVFAPGSVERYQVIVSDPGTEEIFVQDRFEDFAAHWFVTRGAAELLTQSWESDFSGGPGGGDDEAASLDVRWQLPTANELRGEETESGGLSFGPPVLRGEQPGEDGDGDVPEARDSLVVVIKDQRGGIAVGQVTVEYRR